MNKFIRNITFILVFCGAYANAQDMHFTQFYASPLYLNPAFAGSNACARLNLTYRNQWPGISKTYRSYMVAGDHYLQQYNLGIGMLVANDVAGTGNLRTTYINPQLAYEAKFGRDFGMRFGIQPGVTMRSVDFNNLIFADQIVNGGGASTVEIPKANVTFFDMGAGVLAYSSSYWGGISLYHLNRPNQSLLGNEDVPMPIRYTFHGGHKFVLNEEEKNLLQRKSVTAAVHYRGQKEFDQFDIGFYYMQSVMTLGMWYRGLPLKHYKPGYANNDALAFVVGVKTDRFNVGYSYDVTISKLAGASKGAHELNISYQFCVPKKKKKRIEVACPKF
ncbi:MAG: type IX secretion system membrane protein PorP/SprF [Bacteroidota bacterium]|nr:type IX secretion system membrane protein PorP/SprF [Bacteroidota bacterium]